MKMPADASRCERQQARGYVDLVLIRDSHYDKSPRPAYSLVPAGNWGDSAVARNSRKRWSRSFPTSCSLWFQST